MKHSGAAVAQVASHPKGNAELTSRAGMSQPPHLGDVRTSAGSCRRRLVMAAHWKLCIGLFSTAGLLAGCTTSVTTAFRRGTTALTTTTTTTVPKPSASDILACDDFNTDFAQLVAGSPFGDVLVLQAINDGLKASDPGIRLAAHQLDTTLGNQALRSGAPVQTYVLSPLTWALFQDMYAYGAACNRFRIGPP
jgi:hypothetical protein